MPNGDRETILKAIAGLGEQVEKGRKSLEDVLKEHKDVLKEHKKVLDNHTESLQKIVRVIAGPMPKAINSLEEALHRPKTEFFPRPQRVRQS
jgi:predicted phage gp36 major capsid-like protein